MCSGNVCVVMAVVVDRHLHNVANYLVASLAITDLTVASLVLPFAALQVLSSCWFLGSLVSRVLITGFSGLHVVRESSRLDYVVMY